MAAEKSGTPINIDLGIGAKAELRAEFKGEIPQSSMGRLVDAFTDAIRPFTESRGLKADQIRLQREDVMIEIAQKAQRRLAIDGSTPNAIPPRILVPLIEKASLSDPDDADLLEAWSNIMASASKDVRANHILFIDILSKLDAKHLEYLEFLAQPNANSRPIDEFLRIAREDLREISKSVIASILDEGPEYPEEDGSDLLTERLGNAVRTRGSCLIAGGMSRSHGKNTTSYEISSERDFSVHPEMISGALEHLNIIERVSFRNGEYAGIDLWMDYHAFTLFGLEFFYACHGDNIYEE